MNNYLRLLEHVLNNGRAKSDRTGTGTLSVFGPQLEFDLRVGFPLVTTKKVHLKSIIHELLWFLRGSTNATELQDVGVRIWNEWAQPEDVYYRQKRSSYEIKLAWAELKQITVADADEKIKQMTAQFRADHPEMDLEIIEAMVRDLILRDGVSEFKDVLEKAKGELGPVYGKQWRAWPTPSGNIDQIANVIERLKTNPDCRRLIVSAWNVGQLDMMALMPCHNFFQFHTEELTVRERLEHAWATAAKEKRVDALLDRLYDEYLVAFPGTADGVHGVTQGSLINEVNAYLDRIKTPKRILNCKFNMRSADLFLGVPFNIASYALLTMMIGQVVNMVPGTLILTMGDAHIYSNHIEQVKEQLSREPYPLPKMRIAKEVSHIDDFRFEDFELVDYVCHPTIKGEVAV